MVATTMVKVVTVIKAPTATEDPIMTVDPDSRLGNSLVCNRVMQSSNAIVRCQ